MSSASIATLSFTMPRDSLEDIGHWPGSATKSIELDISSSSALMHEDKPPYLGDDFGLKVRKPYTITKQRERWTEEEHQKFLDALKLYGRAWRRIEEHIGTKTTVQIRSHAQKFFCKLEREQSGGGTSTDMAVDIDIPPPRPKRKPNHPYPRKAGGSFSSSPSDMESDCSPSSVPLSYAAVKFVTPPFGEGYYMPPTAIAPFFTPLKQGDHGMSDTTAVARPQPSKLSTSLKLFGQNVVVPTAHKSTDPATTLSLIHASIPSRENTPANSGESGRSFSTQRGSKDEAEIIMEANIGSSFSLFQNVAKLGLKPKAVPGRLLGELDTGFIQKTVNSGVDISCLDKIVLVKQDQESERLQYGGQEQTLNSPSALDDSHHMKSTLNFNSHEAADSIEKSSDWKAHETSTSKLSSHDFVDAISQNLPFNSTGYPSVGPEHLSTFQGIDSQVFHYSPDKLFGPWQWISTNSENLASKMMPGVFPMAVLGLPSLGIENEKAGMSAAAAAPIASASAWWAFRGISSSNQFYPSMGPFYSPVGLTVLSASSSTRQSSSCQAERELGQKLLVQTVQAENDSKDIIEESHTQVLTCKNLDCKARSKVSLLRPTDSNQSARSDLAKSSCNGSCSTGNCEQISCQNKPGKRQQDVHLQKHFACERDQKRVRRGSIESSCTFVSEDVNSCLGTSDSGASLRCLVINDEVDDITGCDGTSSGDGGPSSTSSGCENPIRISDSNDGQFFDNAKDSACLTWRGDGDIQSTTSKLQETLQRVEEKLTYSTGHLISRTSIQNRALDSGERQLRSRADVGIVDGFPKHHGDAMSETELQKEVSDEVCDT
ncbi:hypothetical protein O6H91_16G008500 [Diphasiastrum complanatum]|uniref:Uncharacterized protein n=1 Tax=Diphasiastrum complanatum TaxID=34168 RepID=A0ACC2B9M5_DIPCM|nr:hypothetical protein O6H91_16G008500 [Diphasiastrum complanatum]